MFKIYELKYCKDNYAWRLTQKDKEKKAFSVIRNKDLEEKIDELKQKCKRDNAVFIKYSKSEKHIERFINYPLRREKFDYYYDNNKFEKAVNDCVSNINKLLKFAKDIKLKLKNGNKININLKNDNAKNRIEDKLVKTSKGFYFFEVKFKNYDDINNNFKKHFSKTWEVNNSKRPSIISKRIDKYCNESGRLKKEFHDYWIPFYVGKSKELLVRLLQHIEKDRASKGTYALKLKLTKDKLSDLKFRVGFVEVPFTDRQYDLLGEIIEKEIRKGLPSICGKWWRLGE